MLFFYVISILSVLMNQVWLVKILLVNRIILCPMLPKYVSVGYHLWMLPVLIMIHRMEQVNMRSCFFVIMQDNWIYVGVRDYIHVVDLAIGHIAAMKKFKEHSGLRVCMKNFYW
jgi:hypothetical protein